MEFTATQIIDSMVSNRESLRVSQPDCFQDLEMVAFCSHVSAPLNYVLREIKKSDRYDLMIDGVSLWVRQICGRILVTLSCEKGHMTFQGDAEGFAVSLSELHLAGWEVAHQFKEVSEKFATQILKEGTK